MWCVDSSSMEKEYGQESWATKVHKWLYYTNGSWNVHNMYQPEALKDGRSRGYAKCSLLSKLVHFKIKKKIQCNLLHTKQFYYDATNANGWVINNLLDFVSECRINFCDN